jgi:hypothetical protein
MTFSGSTIGRHSARWLIAVGVGELLLAGLFLFLAFTVPLVGFGFYLAAAILGITGIVLILIGMRVRGSAVAVDQLLATGLSGQAQVTGLTQTGMFLNENPQVAMNLMITIPGRPPYAATRKEFVPLILLGRLTSGAPLPVKVDPADPQRVVIDWQNVGLVPLQAAQPSQYADAGSAAPATGASVDENLAQVHATLAGSGLQAAAPFGSPGQAGYTVEQLRAYLRQNGVQSTARIDRLEDSGRIVGDERLYTTEMTLNIPGGTPTRLPASVTLVPLLAAHKVSVGMEVPVRYAAENPNLLTIEWDRI